MEQSIERTLQNLNNRKINARFFKTREELKEMLLKEVRPGMTVGIGGSMTIKELNLYEELIGAGNEVYWHWMADPAQATHIRDKSTRADVFLTSTNALTEDGELVNIDGTGNRTSSMFYGPKKTIVICGTNKICPDLISGIDRVKNIASIKNAERLDCNTPCVESGSCQDCQSPDRICNITTIISGKPGAIDLNVYIVGEQLGY